MGELQKRGEASLENRGTRAQDLLRKDMLPVFYLNVVSTVGIILAT